MVSSTGQHIQQLCASCKIHNMDLPLLPNSDQEALTHAAKSLLSAITRILLLVDTIVVKQLLAAKNKVTKCLQNLETVVNFTEFVRAFSVFATEMVELAHLIGTTLKGFKKERRMAQMYSARRILERSISILLTSSKINLEHRNCLLAKENRDTVFCQIRRAMDLVHFVIKDSIYTNEFEYDTNQSTCHINSERHTIYSILKNFVDVIEIFRPKDKFREGLICSGKKNVPYVFSSSMHNEKNNYKMGSTLTTEGYTNLLVGNNYLRDRPKIFLGNNMEQTKELVIIFDKLLEKVHDYTDSAYTNHENREKILIICHHCKQEVNNFLKTIESNQLYTMHKLNEEIDGVLRAVKSVSGQLILSVSDEVTYLYNSLQVTVDLIESVHNCAIKCNLDCLQEHANRFHDYCDHIIDVCKLLRHISFTENFHVQTKYLAINIRIYGPQVVTAAKILLDYPSSSPAKENFMAFLSMWKWLTSEIKSIAKQILESSTEQKLGYIDTLETHNRQANWHLYFKTLSEHEKILFLPRQFMKILSTMFSRGVYSMQYKTAIYIQKNNKKLYQDGHLVV